MAWRMFSPPAVEQKQRPPLSVDRLEERGGLQPIRLDHDRIGRTLAGLDAAPAPAVGVVERAVVVGDGQLGRPLDEVLRRPLEQDGSPEPTYCLLLQPARLGDGVEDARLLVVQLLPHRPAFGVVAVEKRFGRPPSGHVGELPTQVEHVLHARVHALAVDRERHVPGVSREQDAVSPKARRDSVVEVAVAEPDRVGEGGTRVFGDLAKDRLHLFEGRIALCGRARVVAEGEHPVESIRQGQDTHVAVVLEEERGMARTQRPTPAQPRVDLADEAPFEPLGSEVEPRSLAREACSTLAAHQPTCAHRLPLSISALQHRHCVGAMVRDVDRRYFALDGSTHLLEPIREDVLDFVLADEDGRSIGTDVAVHRDVAEELAVTMQREGVEWHASLHQTISQADGGEDFLRSGPQIGGLRVSFRLSFLVDDAERHAPAMKLVGEREADRSRADDQNLAVGLHFKHGSHLIVLRKCIYVLCQNSSWWNASKLYMQGKRAAHFQTTAKLGKTRKA